MSEIKKKIREANEDYVLKKELSAHPHRKFAILTCMDARMDPVAFAGLSDDAYVIRNAGGRVTEDAIRSLVISSKLLGSKEWFVIHHTDCGMASFTNEDMCTLLRESLGPATKTENGWINTTDESGTDMLPAMDFLPFRDAEQSLIEDVRALRSHPLVSKENPHPRIYV